MLHRLWTLLVVCLCLLAWPRSALGIPPDKATPTPSQVPAPGTTPQAQPDAQIQAQLANPPRRFVWGVRSRPNGYFDRMATRARTPPWSFEATTGVPPHKWVFYPSAQEAIEAMSAYWRDNRFARSNSRWQFYLFSWPDDGRFPHAASRDFSHNTRARFTPRQFVDLPAFAYRLPIEFQRDPGAFVVNAQRLQRIFADQVPVQPNPNEALINRIRAQPRDFQNWYERAATRLNARCPANPAVALGVNEGASTSGVNQGAGPSRVEAGAGAGAASVETTPTPMATDCAAAAAHVVANDVPWVQNMIQNVAAQTGLSCTEQPGQQPSCSAEKCEDAVARIIREDPDYVMEWARTMAASLGMECTDAQGQADPGCVNAIDQVVTNERPWVREMIELLLHHSGTADCSADAMLVREVLGYLQDRFSMTRETLMQLLRQGPQFLQQHFPMLVDILAQFARSSMMPGKCFDGKPLRRRGLQTSSDVHQQALCDELISGINIEQKRKPGVYVCKNDNFSPPCQYIQAPKGKCINVPAYLDNQVTSMRPEKSAGECTFYEGHGCTGQSITTKHPGLSLAADDKFNDEISSFRCGGAAVAIADGAVRGCKSVDRLQLSLKVGDGWTTGTWSKITMSFPGAQHNVVMVSGARGGVCVRKAVNVSEVFGVPTMPASDLNAVTIWDVLNDGVLASPATLGGDTWQLESFRIDAHCADAPKTLVFQKYINEPVHHHKLHINTPTPVYSLPIEPHDWTVPPSVPKGCKVNLGDTPEHPLEEDCAHIDRLRLDFQLGDGYYQGTWDEVFLHFNDTEKHRIAQSPGPGFHEYQEIDLQAVFGQKRVALDHITKLQVFKHHNAGWGNDDWKIKGIKLRARCANSLSELELSKFYNLNDQITGTSAAWDASKSVWSGAVDPRTDWHKRFECVNLDQLSAHITLGNKAGGGTWDDLYLRLGKSPLKPEFLIAKQPSKGSEFDVKVNITAAYGAPSVPVRDLDFITVYSRMHENNVGDEWELGQIFLHGRCAGSQKHVVVDRHNNIYAWQGRDETFSKDLPLSDWHLADAVSGERIGDQFDF